MLLLYHKLASNLISLQAKILIEEIMAIFTEGTFFTPAKLGHVRNFDLTGFAKDSNLLPCESMLASCVQEVASEKLCDFLQNMDAQEYEILKKENRKYTHLQPNWECFSQLKNRTVLIVSWLHS